GAWMNAPWGVALAPDTGFGKLDGRLLVGMFGSGQIATFDLEHGNFHGMLMGRTGGPLAIEGLWALRFGNGANAGPKSTLFFTAGIDDEEHGLFGKLTTWDKGVNHDETNALLVPTEEDAATPPVGNGATVQQPNSVVIPLVILPSWEDEEK